MGAGILPIAEYKGKLLFLFGKEYVGNDWSDFGGGPSKNESKFETAVREGYEETDGFLGTKADIKKAINKNFLMKLDYKKQYRSYLFKVPYDYELPYYFDLHHIFIATNHPQLIDKNGFFEKTEVEWLTLNDLKNNKYKFRPFYQNIVNQIIAQYPTILSAARKIKV